MNRHCRRVLLVSYFFPPAGGVSVQRVLSLAKYLPGPDCEVDVLTTWNGAFPVMDPALLAQVPNHVRVHRAFTPEVPYDWRRKVWSVLGEGDAKGQNVLKLSQKNEIASGARIFDGVKELARAGARSLFMPDPQVAWNPFAIRAASKLLSERHYDVVLVTAPPFSSFLIGTALKRKFPGIKLVSDFRDDWLGFFLNGVDHLGSDEKRERIKLLEREVVETSDLVVAVTDATLADIRGRYPAEPASKFSVIHNGYDPKAFQALKARPHNTGKMVVTYTGTVYKPCSPRYYLDAIDSLPEEIRSRIETRFVGRVIEEEKPFLANRKSTVRELGFMPQAEALKYLEETDFLLLVVDDPLTLSGKLFEYLASGKPILALTPKDGESGRLVAKARSGTVVEPRDVPAIAQAIRDAFERFTASSHTIEPDWTAIRRFERPKLAEAYRELVRQL